MVDIFSGDPSNGTREAISFPVRPRGQYGDINFSLVVRGGEGMAPLLLMIEDSCSKARRQGLGLHVDWAVLDRLAAGV